jgi:predicted transcriptional regulator
MSIIKTRKSREFISIDNKIITNTDLSDEGYRLLTYLLSKPENWKVYNNEVIKTLKKTEHWIQKAFQNLKKLGYLKRTKTHTNGKYEWITEVSDLPEFLETVEIQPVENQYLEIQGVEIQPIYKEITIQKKIEEKKIEEKKIEEKKTSKKFDADDYIKSLDIDIDLKDAFIGLIEIRKAKRTPTTQRALDVIVKDLKEWYPNNIKKQIECVVNSIKGGWTRVFKIKDYTQNKQNWNQSKSEKAIANFKQGLCDPSIYNGLLPF